MIVLNVYFKPTQLKLLIESPNRIYKLLTIKLKSYQITNTILIPTNKTNIIGTKNQA
jgi:hypothetical protein